MFNSKLFSWLQNLDENLRLNKMRRILLRFENPEAQGSENIETTPLRGNTVRFPRLRLLDQNFEPEDIPKNPVCTCQLTTKSTSQIIRPYTVPEYPKQFYPGDRFIPSRCNFNADAARYILLKKKPDHLKEPHLDVFKQVKSLPTAWQKKFMHQLMVEGNVIPGLRQKQVLRGSHLSSENKSPGNFAEQSKDLWDEKCFEDGMWKSKPRKRPLIGTMESILDIPGFQTSSQYRYHLIDWSSRNVFVAKIEGTLMCYDSRVSQTVERLQNLNATNVCLVKWSGAGDKLVICTISSKIKVYSVEKQKIIWTQKCASVTMFDTPCVIRCACWSKDDQLIVTGCKGLISVYSAKNGEYIDSVRAHTQTLLSLAFSKDYRYLASSALDMDVQIFLWPDMTPFLSICYYEPVKALAWHPHDGSCLCIGGGLGNGSLLLWNVNKVDAVSYRLVKFHGAVENLAWNKRSAELVVHWSCRRRRNRYTVMPVFANLDHIVDVLPVDKKIRVNSILWNFDHTQLAVQCDDSLMIYNFFGNEYQYKMKLKKQHKFREIPNKSTVTNFKEFKYFNIR
ncbi:protein cortex [Osmia lignaria lignaria]|uniref:protein cortex n=1 Tax=Osmia lignaria lignaria TaxID=1437193 RepID=UPI00147966A9|nr:protein cortex-like [Osmia lignaria]